MTILGVCEPTESELCKDNNAAVKEDWEFCQQGELKCDAVHEPGLCAFDHICDMH